MTENLEEVRLEFSTKDIPVPSDFEYQKQLTRAVERLLNRLAWFIWFELNPDERPKRNTYGFKSHKAPPPEAQQILEGFAKDLFHLIRTIEYRDNIRNDFQSKTLRGFLRELKSSEKVFVKSDKGRSYYKMSPEDYDKLNENNITQLYQKATFEDVTAANNEARLIAEELKVDNKCQVHSENQAFTTLKDKKENFRRMEVRRKPCRLINPAKPEVGKISQQDLRRINQEAREKSGLQQWPNTDQMLLWLEKKENKH